MITPTLLNTRYKIIRVLESGGFGETFLAEDTQMPSGRRCVIKQLKPVTHNPQVYQLVQERFQREAAILEELGDGSEQIPRLYAYFSEAGQFYLVQEWIQGQTLSNKLEQEGTLNESSVKEILLSILPVLEYVHSKRIVHRDIKPDNIILRCSDGKPVLIDFGAVKETMGTVLTTGSNSSKSIAIGTPGFMPSEQSAGRPVYSSDLYSLGLTAIYLLTGKMPEQLEADPRTGEIVSRQYALSISPSFAAVLDKTIQPWARDRFSTAREMLEALQFGANAIPPIMPPPLPSVVSAQPISAYAQPPTEVSTLPSGGYVQPPQPVAYPAPVPPSTTTTGLGDWQKAVIMGGVIGACVVGGLFVTRQPSPSTQASSQQSVAQQNISPDPAASDSADSSSPTFVQPQVPSNSAPVPVVAEVPSQTQYSPPPSSISQQDAVDLINAWQQAKRELFAPPFNRQLGAELTTGQAYQENVGPNSSMDWLENNNAYYHYGVQEIAAVESFVASGNGATIEVVITEERTLYINGKIDHQNTDFDTRLVRYSLQSENGQWKISAYKTIKLIRKS